MNAERRCTGRFKCFTQPNTTNKSFKWDVMKGLSSHPKKRKHLSRDEVLFFRSWKNPEFNTLSTFFLIHVLKKITQTLGLKVSELYVSWQDLWNYCLHPSSSAGHMLKPTSWALSSNRETHAVAGVPQRLQWRAGSQTLPSASPALLHRRQF